MAESVIRRGLNYSIGTATVTTGTGRSIGIGSVTIGESGDLMIPTGFDTSSGYRVSVNSKSGNNYSLLIQKSQGNNDWADKKTVTFQYYLIKP